MNTASTTPSADEEPERVARWVYSPIGRSIAPLRRYWREKVMAGVDHKEVVAKIALECPATARYILMVMMSAGIAILGLLLSSPAVVIGAMLLSPLMSPILGVGFALATGKQKWLKISARSLALGSLAAVLFTALIVLVSPLQTVTEEIAARTRPNLFDLLVALARKPWQVFSRETLLEEVWGYRHAADTRLVNVHVQRLRSKIERDPEKPDIIVTVRGVGYKAGRAA